MEAVRTQVLEPQGFIIQKEFATAGDSSEATPTFICSKDDHDAFVTIRLETAPDDLTPLPYTEKRRLLEQAKEHNAACYYIDVFMNPDDATLFAFGPLEQIKEKVTAEWIREAREKIASLAPKTKRAAKALGTHYDASYSKQRVEEPIMAQYAYLRPALDSEYAADLYGALNDLPMPMTFQEKLMEFIRQRGMTNPQFYNAAMIDRKLFSAIKNNRLYKPKKDTAVACCFGLRLNLKEAEQLLEAAGYKLSLSILWDRIIYFCLDHDITDLDIVNELLYEENQKCIGVLE